MRRTTKSILTSAVLVPALVAGLVAGTGTADAVANGELVPNGKYTFAVKLTMTGIPTADGGRRNSACSGALISPEWIITAGHCFRTHDGVRVDRTVADLTTATVGRADVTGTGGHVIEVVAVRQAPNTDMALAKLKTPIRNIQPLRVGTRPAGIGSVVRITGFGSITSTNPVPETRLRTGQMTVVSLTSSITGLRGYAPKPNTTPCPYDSGAPYFQETRAVRPVLVAVVSNGPSCPHTEVESGARTDNIADWIFAVIGRRWQTR